MRGAGRHGRAWARILLIVAMGAALILLRLVSLPVAWVSANRDRRNLRVLKKIWGRVVCAIAGIRVVQVGEVPKSPCVLVCNHLSYLDIVVLSATCPGVFVAKSEVAAWPLVGTFSRLARTLFVDRARKRDLLRVIDGMVSALREGDRVIFFPEATSSGGEGILPFKSSLFEAPSRASAGVRCASLRYELPHDAPPVELAVCWWAEMTFPDHCYRLLGLPGLRAELRFGDEALFSPERKPLAREARAAVERLFVPTSARRPLREVDAA